TSQSCPRNFPKACKHRQIREARAIGASMPKTKRDLFCAIAAAIGGERGKRMADAVRHLPFPELLDRPITDEEFDRQLEIARRDLPQALASFEALGPELRSWGFDN